MSYTFTIPGPSDFVGYPDDFAFSGKVGRGQIPSDIASCKLWLEADPAYCRTDGGAKFEASNSEQLTIAHGTQSGLDFGDEDFTLAGWMYIDSFAALQGIITKDGGNSSRGYGLAYIHSSTAFRFHIADGATNIDSQLASSFGAPSTGRWYFVVAWYDASESKMSICVNDGTVDTSSASAIDNADGGNTFRIGSWERTSVMYQDGRVDSAAVWGRVLTAPEITWLFNNGVGRKYADIGSTGTDGSALKTSLVSWWDLDEASGTRTDAHGSNDLSDNGTVQTTAGVTGVAASFTSANSEYLSIADNADLSFGDEDFTITCWVFVSSLAADKAIVGKWKNGTDDREYLLQYSNTDNRFQFLISADGSTPVSVDADTLGAPSASTWYFIVCEHDATANTISIEVNDGGADSESHSGGSNDNVSAFNVGAKNDGADTYIDGRICNVGVWGRTLTSAEKTWLYNLGDGQTFSDFGVSGTDGSALATSAIAYWPMNEFSGTRSDYVGSNNLSDNNTVVFANSFQTALGEDLSDNSPVASWIDRSSNEKNAIQSTHANKPTFETDVVNGKPAIHFDGTNDLMSCGLASDWKFLHDGTGFTAYIVAYADDLNPGDAQRLLATQDGSASATGIDINRRDNGGSNDAAEIRVGDGSGTWLLDHTTADDLFDGQDWKIIEFTYDEGISGDDSSITVNDGAADTADTTGSTPNTGNSQRALLIGALNGSVSPFDGYIYAVLLFDEILSDSDKNDMRQYLSDQVGVAV